VSFVNIIVELKTESLCLYLNITYSSQPMFFISSRPGENHCNVHRLCQTKQCLGRLARCYREENEAIVCSICGDK